MQRLGRKGHPTYRVVVQDSRLAPTSGKYVALLGSYDPHTKQSSLAVEKAQFYLDHGAQPSDRVVSLFKTEKITLPKWVKEPTKQERQIRNPEKLRRNRPAQEEEPAPEPTETSEGQNTESTAESSEVQSDAADETSSSKQPENKPKEVPKEAESEAKQSAEEPKPESEEKESSEDSDNKKSEKKEETSK